jgi:hypothetical protein
MRLTIYSKPGCHLCDDMKAVVRDTLQDADDVSVEQVDISTDPALLELYGLEVPVLLIDGRKAAKYRITQSELRQKMERAGFRAPGA